MVGRVNKRTTRRGKSTRKGETKAEEMKAQYKRKKSPGKKERVVEEEDERGDRQMALARERRRPGKRIRKADPKLPRATKGAHEKEGALERTVNFE